MEISDKLIDKLVDKFLDLLTDKIAEKVAEKIYKDSISIPNNPINPIVPDNPKIPPYGIKVMYGVMTTPYTAIDDIKAETSFTNITKIKD